MILLMLLLWLVNMVYSIIVLFVYYNIIFVFNDISDRYFFKLLKKI